MRHHSGQRPTLGRLPPFDTRGSVEKRNLLESFSRPFSGYLGGIHKGGYWVERLADEWCQTFGCRHAVPCNSATSGLLAACIAVGIGPGDLVWAPATTMSATAACAKVLGARVQFIDIEENYFSFDLLKVPSSLPKAIIVTNLFGHPALALHQLRQLCDAWGIPLIEDNAQSPFAKSMNCYTGTIGHIGVFSLNIHKHMQTGEGGVVVTSSDDLALKVKDAINHGELRGGRVGLNLRMTEPIAALACGQLEKSGPIIAGRQELGEALTEMVKDIPQIIPPKVAHECTHVYYIWAAKFRNSDRDLFLAELQARGIPFNIGYSPPLNRVFQTNESCPVAEELEDKTLITFDVCSYSPKKRQLNRMREIIHEVAEDRGA